MDGEDGSELGGRVENKARILKLHQKLLQVLDGLAGMRKVMNSLAL